MSQATIGVTGAVDTALRRAFSEASVRVKDDTKLSDVLAAMKTLGIECTVEDGLLMLKQGDTELHTHKALRNFSKRPECARFFVLATDDPRTWTMQQRIEFVRLHGADAYGKLLVKPVLDGGIRTLDPNMSRTDYLNLTLKEKTLFLREYGDEAARNIMRKAK